ncbi:MAG: DUF4345 domain-containing protein [Pseudomonadota bacterium]
MTRYFLGLNALLFLGFGVYVILNPQNLAETMQASGMGTDGLYEIRSNYGGVSIGAGLLYLFGALRRSLERPALYFLLAYTGGYALGRILALPFDGLPSERLIAFGVFEAVTALVAALLLLRRPSTMA